VETLVLGRPHDIAGIVVACKRTRSARTLLRLAVDEWKSQGLRGFIASRIIHLRTRVLNSLRHALPIRGAYSTKAVAERHSIPFHPCRDVNEPGFLKFLSRELDPDVIVSLINPQIFRRGILGLPRLGCINVHPSLLPKYRGPIPQFWVLAHDEAETGVTVHYMDEKIDNGDIILQSRVAIRPKDTPHSIQALTLEQGAQLVLHALEQMETGTLSLTPNDSREATYYSFPTIEDARALRRKGRKLP
jgi:methionyl-tRNA formyltransferase